MKRINHWLIICFVLLLTVACTSGKQSKSASWQDLHYGPDSLQTMDVYLLENRTADTPLMILVHGGGPEISGTLKKMNKESKFIHGLRYTDDETIDVVQMVLAGKTNKDLVKLIMQSGGNAVGISGIDNQLIVAKKHECEDDLGYVGDIDKINPNIILDMLEKGYIPVIASVGTDEEGHTYNINADTAAAEIAGALGAENMILVSDIPGLLFDKDDESTLIPLVHVYEVKGLEDKGIISGGMIPKVECCVRAIRQNVKKAVIIDGRIPHSILIEMLSKEGIGTMFKR